MKFRILITLVVIIFFAGCSSTLVDIGEIRIKGSNTMLPLTKKLADEYMATHSGISIIVEGGGTSLGINALIENQIQICTASRNLESEETRLLANKFGTVGVSTLIARDAIGIYVNNNNPINNLSTLQIKEIFSGKTTSWKQVGWDDVPIQPVIRNDYSGTVSHFHSRVLEGQDFSKTAIIKSKVEDLFEEVEKNKNAITFSGFGYESNCKMISVDNVGATEENVKNMSYPLSRYLHFYTINVPTGVVKDFIDWVLSREGQKIVKEFGFVALYDFSF